MPEDLLFNLRGSDERLFNICLLSGAAGASSCCKEGVVLALRLDEASLLDLLLLLPLGSLKENDLFRELLLVEWVRLLRRSSL